MDYGREMHIVIPEWIRNVALWWSQDLIDDREFIRAMEWLVSKGILQV